MSTSRGDAIRRLRPAKMTKRQEFAELREIITADDSRLWRNSATTRLLDCLDKAVAALGFYERHEKKLDAGETARKVLADLDKEI
jgi:hypothetical protein